MDLTPLKNMTYGLYIVSSFNKGHYNGQIVDAVMQVSIEPIIIAVAVNKKNLTHDYIKESGYFSISILEEETPMEFIGRFGFRTGRDFDKFKGIKFEIGPGGCPVVIDHTLGYIVTEVIDHKDCGSHTVFFGSLINSKTIKYGKPLTYRYYLEVIKGKVHMHSPMAALEDAEVG